MKNPYKIDNFRGGLNFSADEEQIPRNATQRAENVDISDGSLKTANGYCKYIDTQIPGGGSIGSIMEFYKNGVTGIESSLVGASGTKVYYWDGDEWIEIGSSFTSDIFSSLVWQKETTELLILTNGKESPQKWAGPGDNLLDLDGSPPIMKSIALHRERLWGVGDPNHLSGAWYSNELNPEDWVEGEDDAGRIDILTWDGGICIAIVNVFDDPVIYKTHNIWRIAGTYPSEYSQNQIFTTKGAIAPRSVVTAGPMAFHLCDDGIYTYDSNQTSLLGGDVIRPWFVNNLNMQYAQMASAAIHDSKLYMAFPTGISTVNNAVIEYDMINGNFMLRTGIEVAQFLKYDNKLLFVNRDGYVYEYDNGHSYDGSAIRALYETPWEFGKNRFSQKQIYRLKMRLNGKAKITFITDNNERSYVFETTKEELIDKPVFAKGERFKVRFENVNGSRFVINEPQFGIDEWVI